MSQDTPSLQVRCDSCNTSFKMKLKRGRLPAQRVPCPKCKAPIDLSGFTEADIKRDSASEVAKRLRPATDLLKTIIPQGKLFDRKAKPDVNVDDEPLTGRPKSDIRETPAVGLTSARSYLDAMERDESSDLLDSGVLTTSPDSGEMKTRPRHRHTPAPTVDELPELPIEAIEPEALEPVVAEEPAQDPTLAAERQPEAEAVQPSSSIPDEPAEEPSSDPEGMAPDSQVEVAEHEPNTDSVPEVTPEGGASAAEEATPDAADETAAHESAAEVSETPAALARPGLSLPKPAVSLPKPGVSLPKPGGLSLPKPEAPSLKKPGLASPSLGGVPKLGNLPTPGLKTPSLDGPKLPVPSGSLPKLGAPKPAEPAPDPATTELDLADEVSDASLVEAPAVPAIPSLPVTPAIPVRPGIVGLSQSTDARQHEVEVARIEVEESLSVEMRRMELDVPDTSLEMIRDAEFSTHDAQEQAEAFFKSSVAVAESMEYEIEEFDHEQGSRIPTPVLIIGVVGIVVLSAVLAILAMA